MIITQGGLAFSGEMFEIDRIWRALPLIIGWLMNLLVLGCSDSKQEVTRNYVIQVNDRRITIEEFNTQFENMTHEYRETMGVDKSGESEMRRYLLNQLIERLILLERAEELDLHISDKELEDEIQEIKKDYPDETFEAVLLEQAVSYRKWKKELRTRMLLEKVIETDMKPLVTLTPADISAYYEKYFIGSEGSTGVTGQEEELNDSLLRLASNKKKEEAYQSWISKLQQRYRVDVNLEAWKKLNEAFPIE